MATPRLRFCNLCLDFVHEHYTIAALRGINLTLHAGEILALVGESGCGKSVLLKSVLGLNASRAKLKAGAIYFYPATFDGKLSPALDLTHLPEGKLRKLRGQLIAAMFQDSEQALHPTIAVGQQIVRQLKRLQGLSELQAQKRMLELLTTLHLPQATALAQRVPAQLSGGQRQRCALALALAGQVQVLLADEITSALDLTARRTLLRLLLQLKQAQDLSVLFVTHDLAAAAAVADRIGVMYAGRLVEIGSATEICFDPRHPYTKALLAAQPASFEPGKPLPTVPGQAPRLLNPPPGDLFARRDAQALGLDYVRTPPFFALSATHAAATWQLHPKVCGINYQLCPEMMGENLD